MANGQKEISGKHTHFIVHLCLCMKKMAHICHLVNIASKKITQPWDYIIIFSFVERLTYSLLLYIEK